MGETYLWHIWPARHWPCSDVEELLFIEELSALAGDLADGEIRPHERGDLTTVMNALRNGMTVVELLAVAPGVRPERLVSAYRHIDALRRGAVDAFDRLCADPNEHTALEHGPAAAQLVPVPTYRLVAAAGSDLAARRETERTEVALLVEATAAETARVEAELGGGDGEPDGLVRLGRVLYDPFAGGMWSNPYFVPRRVGSLVPARIRDLLGEPPE